MKRQCDFPVFHCQAAAGNTSSAQRTIVEKNRRSSFRIRECTTN